MARAYEQFVHFGTDIVGLERFLRLVQSICHVLSSSPSLLLFLLPILQPSASHPSPDDDSPSAPLALTLVSLSATILHLRNQINLIRRTLRTFRFLDSFSQASSRLSFPFSSSSAPTVDTETYLEITSYTLLGIYGLLETGTLPDVFEVPGLSAWGPDRSAALNLEAQRCWFLALAFSFSASGMRVLRSMAFASVPPTGEGFATIKEGDEKKSDEEKEKEREEVRKKREADTVAESARRRKIGWRMAADGLDMLLPAATLGWVPGVEQWAVGMTMLVTTLITGKEVWERCGVDVDMKNAR